MEHMNVVRMRIKPGKFEEWKALAAENLEAIGRLDGLLDTHYIKTSEDGVCVIGRWASQEALAAARPKLVAGLDRIRHLLDGDTDPVSGPVILARGR